MNIFSNQESSSRARTFRFFSTTDRETFSSRAAVSAEGMELISTFRPKVPLFATSPNEQTIRRTCFYWGVYAYRTTEQGSLSSTLYDALTTAKKNGLVETGDIVVITAGDPQTSPRLGDYTTSTNMAMVAQVQ